MGFVEGLQCRECGRKYDVSPVYVCEFCFGPLEVTYRYDEIKERLPVEETMRRPKTMRRYKDHGRGRGVSEGGGIPEGIRGERGSHRVKVKGRKR